MGSLKEVSVLSGPSIRAPTLQSNAGTLSGLAGFLKSHPILFLLVLTPGIPEYLSASSQLTLLVVNPLAFFLFLAANLGLYGSGVILIREAMIRWKKGWASVFLLGVAYGIAEEGLALWTLFNPLAQQVGSLGFYGHWLGVNWVWTMGLLIFHSVYSIGLPIFLFGLVFPELKNKSLVSGLGIKLSVYYLTLDSIALFALNSALYPGYNPGVGLILVSGLVITILVVAARKLPGNLLKTRLGPPEWNPLRFGFVGSLLFPATILAEGISQGANLPPEIPFALDLGLSVFILQRAYSSMGTEQNQEQKVAFSVGLLLPIAVFGIIASIGLANPLIIVADTLLVMFSRRLWRKWHNWTILQQHGLQTELPSFGRPPEPSSRP